MCKIHTLLEVSKKILLNNVYGVQKVVDRANCKKLITIQCRQIQHYLLFFNFHLIVIKKFKSLPTQNKNILIA